MTYQGGHQGFDSQGQQFGGQQLGGQQFGGGQFGYPPVPGQAYPAAAGGYPSVEPPLVTIGDITCTQSQIMTPSGTFPIAGSQWAVSDMSHSTEKISTAGIVLAIVGVFLVCILSLLFLLMKERQTTGYIQVSVRAADGRVHVTNIPAHSPMTMAEVSSMVNYARSVAAIA